MEIEAKRVFSSNGKWEIIFVNEPSEEAVQAYGETVCGYILEHIQKKAKEQNP